MKKHVNALAWAGWASGDLSLWQWMDLQLHLRLCRDCREHRRALAQQMRAYQKSDAFERTRALMRLHRRPRVRAAISWPLGAVGAMAALLGAVYLGDGAPAALRGKGAGVAAFSMHVATADGSRPLAESCRPGDRLRARLQSPHPHVIIVEVDGTQAATVVFPKGSTQSGVVPAGSFVTPGSWALDATPGEERFVALFSEKPIQATEALARAQTPQTTSAEGVVRMEVRCRKP